MLIVAAACLAPFALYFLYRLRRAPAAPAPARKTAPKMASPRQAKSEPVIRPEEQQDNPERFIDEELAAAAAAAQPAIVRRTEQAPVAEAAAAPPPPVPPEPEPEPQPAPEPAPAPAPAPPPPAAAADEEFPPVESDRLQERFYYLARMRFEHGIEMMGAHQISEAMAKEAGLRLHQTTLCYSRENGRWELPRSERSYREMVWGVPLCNRRTKLSEELLPAIVKVLQSQMRKHRGVADFPAKADIENRLAAAEEFCEAVDKKLTATLIAVAADGGEPRKSGDIFDLALAEGLEEDGDGMLRRQVNGETWYTMSTGEKLRSPDRKVARLEAVLDFPHVSEPIAAFDDMFELMGKLARVLKFQLVDNAGAPISADGIAATRGYLMDLESEMRAEGVQPGGRLARALFSG